jgi:hypothetical protein
MDKTVLSRHRLPNRYRYSIAALWLAPIALFLLAILAGKGLDPALLDPRLVVPVALLTVPALYIWQEGVDVLPGGIRTRVHIPHYHDYAAIEAWRYEKTSGRKILTIWGRNSGKVLECHAVHLSDLPLLLEALSRNIPPRSWRS